MELRGKYLRFLCTDFYRVASAGNESGLKDWEYGDFKNSNTSGPVTWHPAVIDIQHTQEAFCVRAFTLQTVTFYAISQVGYTL